MITVKKMWQVEWVLTSAFQFFLKLRSLFRDMYFLPFVLRGHEANICAVLPETFVSSAVFLYIAQAWRFCKFDKHPKKVNKSKQGAM